MSLIEAIQEILRREGPSSTARIAFRLGRTTGKTAGMMSHLRRRGLVVMVERSKSGIRGHPAIWKIDRP